MSELVDFLLARIAEDGEAVRDAACRCKPGEAVRPDCPERLVGDSIAKRRIIAEHSGAEEFTGAYCPEEDGRYLRDRCPTLLALAAPYFRHPDYNYYEWLPDDTPNG